MDETRILRIEARLELRELVARYGCAVDERDLSGLGNLFATNATLKFAGASVAIGSDAIVLFYADRLTQIRQSFHVVHDQVLEFDPADPNSASGLVTSHAEMWRSNGANIAAIRYHDSYVRAGGRWLFGSRELAFFYYLPISEYQSALGDPLRMRANPSRRAAANFPEELSTWRDFWSARAF